MRGLIEKDIRLLAQRKQFLILFLVISMILANTMEGTFIIGYVSLLMALFSVSTINYDEAERGYSFIMTLPVSRKDYVTAKYVFCLSAGAIGWILANLMQFVALLVKGTLTNPMGEIVNNLIFVPIFVIAISLLISFQLKFGAEKSRLMLMLFCGAVAAISVATATASKGSYTIIKTLDAMPFATSFGIVCAVAVVAVWVTYRWAVAVMEKKEL